MTDQNRDPDRPLAGQQDQVVVRLPDEEFELKLDIDPSKVDALLDAAPLNDERAQDREQNSVYFDTPDHALRTAGFSLRVRTIGNRRVQTIKATGVAAAGLFIRPEWERDITSDTPELLEGGTPLHGLIDDADLARIEAVFSVQVVRRTVIVERGNAVIEVVLDRGEVVGKRHSNPVHELEFELKKGDPTALFELAYALDEIAPLRLGVLSKSERGYLLGSAAAGKPVKTASLTLDPATTTKHGFQTIVGACLRQFRLNEAVLVTTDDAGSLHQARVSLRRLRSALSTFKPVVSDDRYEHLRSELRWIAAELGNARNIDVLIERLTGRKAAEPLVVRREGAYAAVQQALRSDRLRRLMLELSEWLAIGQWTVDSERADIRDRPLVAFASKALSRHRRRLKRLGRGLAVVSDEKRHDARIEAKKLRYATEFFGSLYTSDKAVKRRHAFYKRLADLQSHLGELNDIATAPIVLADLDLVATKTEAALKPDLSRRGSLIVKAAAALDALMEGKRFWR